MEYEICQKVIGHYGITSQMIVAMGELAELTKELAELTKELAKYLRYEGDNERVAEKMADVHIVLMQLEIIYGNRVRLEEWKAKKLLKLSNKIDKEKEGYTVLDNLK
jgi:NTP pyrophosphatase (non-canonical NTP hydrolase)